MKQPFNSNQLHECLMKLQNSKEQYIPHTSNTVNFVLCVKAYQVSDCVKSILLQLRRVCLGSIMLRCKPRTGDTNLSFKTVD